MLFFFGSFVHLLSVATFCQFQTCILLLLLPWHSQSFALCPIYSAFHSFDSCLHQRYLPCSVIMNVSIISMLCHCPCQYLCFGYAFGYISVMLPHTINMSCLCQCLCHNHHVPALHVLLFFLFIDEDGSVVGVFGGFVNRSSTSDHSIYFLDTRTWTWTMSSSNTVRGRSYSACAMTGNQFIVWGGKSSPNILRRNNSFVK